MSLFLRLSSLPYITLAAAPQFILLVKLLPESYSSDTHLYVGGLILLANYGLGFLFRALLYPKFFSPLRHIPGPKTFVNTVYRSLLAKNRPAGDMFLDLLKQYPGKELIMLNALGDHVLVTNPRLLADVLVNNCYDYAKPSNITSFLRLILGNGLIVIEGNQHKFLRKICMPAFRVGHIKELYPMIWDKAQVLAGALQQEVASGNQDDSNESTVIELSAWASKVTFDIIGVAGLGRNFHALEKGDDRLQSVYEKLLEPGREKIMFAALCFGFGFSTIRLLPWKMNKLFMHPTSSLNQIIGPMIRGKRDAIHEKADDHFDILSLLIKSGDFAEEALKDQLLTFLAAGHETTASAITWACYLVSKDSEIQEKLRIEVGDAFPGGPKSCRPEELAGILEQLPYLNGILQETLRLYPIAPLTLRQALRDTQVGDQFIPKGTVLVLSIWMMNRSPEIWGPSAGDFCPERWITDTKPNQHGGAKSNYDFLTFLHGPRSCIEQGFAQAEMRCLMAMMIMQFSWDLAMTNDKVVPKGVITIKPEHGLYLRLRAR